MPIKFRNIESERVRLGLSQEALSKKLNVTRQTYGKQIRGKSAFCADQLFLLREITGKSIDYLLVEYDDDLKVSEVE